MCWVLLIELPGSIPVYLLQKIVCFEIGHEAIHNGVVPSDDILLGEVSRAGGQVVQFYDAGAILLQTLRIGEALVVLLLIRKAIICSSDINALFEHGLVAE